MRKILQYILKILSKIIIWKYDPEIIAITGSVGKTNTREAIYRVLKKQFRVRRNIKNYNNEIGVPLTILGQDLSPEMKFSSLFSWLKIFLKAGLTIIWDNNYPEILILEMGVAEPGDMEYLLSFIPVKVGIFTAIGEFPSHIEFFPEKGKLVEEKALLVKSLGDDGLAVMNYDDLTVRMVGDDLPKQIKTMYYGFGYGADLRINNYETKINDLEKSNFGVSFKIEYKGSIMPIKLSKIIGKQKVYAAAAAAAVGLHYGLNLVEISSVLIKLRSVPGRVNLIKGIKKTYIIDDTYNASPLSTIVALELMREISSERKIAVLGDMLELGIYTEQGHQQVGEKAAEIADIIFTVGDKARFIAYEAEKRGFPKDKIFRFSTSDEAKLKVQDEIKQGDIVLVKGSRRMRMEKIVKEIMDEPKKAEKLLIS
ncbi:UDP-N-acetylmuramoyl-tripeptide--D-alanyl-D-alanine ligase [Patescibacteria group bacterium]